MVLRFGILGAAAIAPAALIEPARTDPEVEVTAVAARNQERAQAFAASRGIPRAHPSYADLLADPEVDAVYNPLPNGLHGRWTVAALEAGKHVLCEKPFAANAVEAEQVAKVAERSGLVVMEAFHYRYHPLTLRLLEIIGSGELGELHRLEAYFTAQLRDRADIRWDLGLAGGALMDIGCYPLHLLRTLAGDEPTVVSARAKTRIEGVDRSLRAELTFPGDVEASFLGSMLSPRTRSGAAVVGSEGQLRVTGFVHPHSGHRLVVRAKAGRRVEQVHPEVSTYTAQLRAFVDAVLRGTPFPTGTDDAIAQMRAIDGCYLAAGLPVREPTPW